jgi:hypothetical protein
MDMSMFVRILQSLQANVNIESCNVKVMYMHYLLGQRIFACSNNKKEAIKKARRTFILALDGDVDFRPEALIHLVDLMKRSLTVAASCGRIHPNGSGSYLSARYFKDFLGRRVIFKTHFRAGRC